MPRDFWLRLVHLYVDESHKYYVLEEPNGISDGYFDDVCKRLYEDFEEVPEDLRWFLDREELRAGTGFSISSEQYQRWYATGGKEHNALRPPYE